MTKQEFMSRLQEALENDLSAAEVQEQMRYYSAYVDDEVRRGRAPDQVLEELGDPWVIAQSVISMQGQGIGKEAHGRSGAEECEMRFGSYQVHTMSGGAWWQKLLVLLAIVGVFLLVGAVIGGLITLILPIVPPVLIVVLLIWLIRRS